VTSLPRALHRARIAGNLSLLTSAGTLVCCTIPAVLIAVGAGTVLGSAVATFPAIVWLSEYKELVFGIAAAMLLIAGAMQWRARYAPCPPDAARARACLRARRLSRVVYSISVLVFGVGAFFAFALPVLD